MLLPRVSCQLNEVAVPTMGKLVQNKIWSYNVCFIFLACNVTMLQCVGHLLFDNGLSKSSVECWCQNFVPTIWEVMLLLTHSHPSHGLSIEPDFPSMAQAFSIQVVQLW